MDNYFSLNIEYLRKTRGLTQAQLADNVDITPTAISAWENKKSYPSALTLLKLSNKFDVSLDDLLKKDLAKAGDSPTMPDQSNDKSSVFLLETAIKAHCPDLADKLGLL